MSKLRARQKIGKYRILGRIASGPLAGVYKALDPIHRERVALKIPAASAYSGDEEFLHEVQVARKLQHPNILSVINASYIDDHFVIAMELGDESLADRIERRISTARAMDLAGQGLAALAHAHEHRIIHCDIKPENFILFPGGQLFDRRRERLRIRGHGLPRADGYGRGHLYVQVQVEVPKKVGDEQRGLLERFEPYPTRLEQRPGGSPRVGEAAPHGLHQEQATAPGGLAHGLDLRCVHGERLLAEHRLAGAGGE